MLAEGGSLSSEHLSFLLLALLDPEESQNIVNFLLPVGVLNNLVMVFQVLFVVVKLRFTLQSSSIMTTGSLF